MTSSQIYCWVQKWKKCGKIVSIWQSSGRCIDALPVDSFLHCPVYWCQVLLVVLLWSPQWHNEGAGGRFPWGAVVPGCNVGAQKSLAVPCIHYLHLRTDVRINRISLVGLLQKTCHLCLFFMQWNSGLWPRSFSPVGGGSCFFKLRGCIISCNCFR